MAGITCARRLHDAGLEVEIFEKSRGIGGRLATRRTEFGNFDHGAPFFSAASDRFAAFAAEKLVAGSLAFWSDASLGATQSALQFVGLPGMNAFLKPESRPLRLHTEATISLILDDGEKLLLEGSTPPPNLAGYSHVVVTAPAPQAAQITANFSSLKAALESVVFVPSWVLMISVRRASHGPAGLVAAPHPDIKQMVQESAKPGRAPDQDIERWVVHCTDEFSIAALEETQATIIDRVLPAALETLKAGKADVVHCAAHRWRYATALKAAGAPVLMSADGRVIVAGDGCTGGGVEGAYESGWAAAEAILNKASTN
mgnify:CR=1 FL=1